MSDERKPDFESAGVHEIDLADLPTEVGILPLRDTLLFPQAVLPLAVARESSVALVNDAVKERKVIGVLTQRDPAVDEPLESDLYGTGTLTHIHKMFRFPDGSLRLVVQGIQRFRILQVTQYPPFLRAQVELIREEPTVEDHELKIGQMYLVSSTPTVFVIRRDGVIDSVLFSGEMDYARTLEAKKAQLLKVR